MNNQKSLRKFHEFFEKKKPFHRSRPYKKKYLYWYVGVPLYAQTFLNSVLSFVHFGTAAAAPCLSIGRALNAPSSLAASVVSWRPSTTAVIAQRFIVYIHQQKKCVKWGSGECFGRRSEKASRCRPSPAAGRGRAISQGPTLYGSNYSRFPRIASRASRRRLPPKPPTHPNVSTSSSGRFASRQGLGCLPEVSDKRTKSDKEKYL